VYGQDHELLYYASIPAAERLLANGRVIAVGTTQRVRALIAVAVLSPSQKLLHHFPNGVRYTYRHETAVNPPRVWALKRLKGTAA
jgi:hypothetical protein